ncbi:MAG: SIMPL domain-containing protein [bacterium]|nr:SIMPL domain-containing protein [bacterium]
MNEEQIKNCCCPPGNCTCGNKCCKGMFYCEGAVIFHKIKGVLLLVVLLLAIGWLGGQIRNDNKKYDYIGKAQVRDTISVEGEGKVVGVPDVATINLGLLSEAANVGQAQVGNTNKMNALLEKVKSFGVDSKDIQTTNYTISPRYDYPDGRQILRGYQVSQSVQVKIRDLSKIGGILAAAGEVGANQVSGVAFTIDEPESLRQQAREKAMENALAKAQALAKKAGVKLGKLVSFNEYNSSPTSYYKGYEAYGLGGATPQAAPTPSVEAGSLDITINVNLTYEIL